MLALKNYNPCGSPTGSENEICNAALTSYFNLPFVQVMRNVAISECTKKFPIQNEAAILNWANYNLNEIEMQAAINFENAAPLEIGLHKFILHLLFENRYNIEYNRLANVLNKNIYSYAKDISAENLEQKINSIAQNTNYHSTFDDMTAELENVIR